MTSPAWESSNAYGHANLFLRTPDVDGGTWNWKPDLSPSQVTWDKDVVMVPHHPNCGQIVEYGKHREVMGQSFYWSKYHWEFPNERARLVEIVQGRGNFEADALDDYWGIRLGEQGASVQDAFAQGWRLGFVAGTDNHQGYPTHSPGAYVGMTCFRATELTREAVWQAMVVKGRPIVATTAILGGMMGVFWVSSFPPVVHFGLLLAVGLIGALIAALVLLPAWLGRPRE